MRRAVSLLTQIPVVISALAILAMAGVTLVDIAGRNLLGLSVFGAFEMVQIALAIAIFGGLAEVSRKGGHITVDIVDAFLPPRAVSFLKRLSAASFVVLAGILIYAGWKQAETVYQWGENTGDLGLSKLVFWIPILAGLTGAALTAAATCLRGADHPAGDAQGEQP